MSRQVFFLQFISKYTSYGYLKYIGILQSLKKTNRVMTK